MKMSPVKKITAAILLVIAVAVVAATPASAQEPEAVLYNIRSIQIEQGDSLWSIAGEHYNSSCGTLAEYISEIKRLNGITSDTLYAGSYLLVPEYKEGGMQDGKIPE